MPTSPPQDNCILIVVDALDRIEQIGGLWLQSAGAGGAADLLQPQQVLGQPLSRFIEGDTTRMYCRALLQHCRIIGESKDYDYRCDTPDSERLMRMQTRRLDGRRVEMRHFLLHSRPLPHPLTFSTAHTSATARMKRCSICNRLSHSGSEQWFEAASLVQEQPQAVTVIYTVCHDCKGTNWRTARAATPRT